MALKVKDSGSWKAPKTVSVKDNGSWKSAKKVFVKNNGSWQEVFSAIITDGLILHLDASDISSYPGSGTIWYDLSGHGNNVTMDSIFTPTFNSTDKSFFFDDGDNFETQTANEVMTNAITMISWYKRTGAGKGSPRVLEMIQNGAANGAASHALAIDTDGSYRAWIDVSGTSSSRLASADDATAYGTGIWYMYAYTYDGATGRIYHNGVQTATASGASSNIDDINRITIGAIPDVGYTHNAHCFTGNIAITQVYNKTLSAAEILQNFETTRSRFGI